MDDKRCSEWRIVMYIVEGYRFAVVDFEIRFVAIVDQDIFLRLAFSFSYVFVARRIDQIPVA